MCKRKRRMILQRWIIASNSWKDDDIPLEAGRPRETCLWQLQML